jgi:predicted PurR-regulated permease PerM
MRDGATSGPFDSVASFSWRFLAALGAGLAILALLMTLHSVTVPVIVALLLCSATTPLVRYLSAKGMKPLATAGIASLSVLLLVIVLVTILVVTVGRQWDDITGALAQSLEGAASWLKSIGLPADVIEAGKQDLLTSLKSLAPVIVGGTVRFLSAAVTFVMEIILALLLMFYFLIGGNDMWQWLLRQAGRPDGGRLDNTARRCWIAVENYMFGTLIVGLCDGAVIGLGLWIIGVPSALALGVLTVFAEFIPLIGPTVMGIVAVLLAYGHGGFRLALLALVIIWPVQQINGHVTAPIVYGKTISLSPIVVLLAILSGGIIGGMLGMLIAVPVAGVMSVILAELRAPALLEYRSWPDRIASE